MSALLILGSLVLVTGRCGTCGVVRAAFVNLNGRTCCAVCAARSQS